jgi:hypothetical protein
MDWALIASETANVSGVYYSEMQWVLLSVLMQHSSWTGSSVWPKRVILKPLQFREWFYLLPFVKAEKASVLPVR